jgi:hypothetical protein
MYWPVHFKISQDIDPDGGDTFKRMSSFIFDESLDASLSFEMWLATIRELAQLLPNDHVMKSALDAIPSAEAAAICLASVFGMK